MKERYLEKEKLQKILDMFDNGFLTYKKGHIYRLKKRQNKHSVINLDVPEIASALTKQGYRRILMRFEGKQIFAYEHRVVFALVYGVDELYKYECIDHIDGNKANNNITNLRGLTIKENTNHAENMGQYKRTYGELNGVHKLSKEEISKIRKEYEEGSKTQYELAALFNITQGHVSEIVNFKKRKYA